jgi:hypothetical protein
MARYCEHCGDEITPGNRFCEECGRPIVTLRGEEDGAGCQEPRENHSSGGAGDTPLAVIPFAYTAEGFFRTNDCTLVVYRDCFVVAFVPEPRKKEMSDAMTGVMAKLMEKDLEGKKLRDLVAGAGFSLLKIAWSAPDFYTGEAARERQLLESVTVDDRPWERYSSMASDEVLAEDPRNILVHKDSVGAARGESDLSTDTDQILVWHKDGQVTLYFRLGTFYPARAALFFMLHPGGLPETVHGVIPSGSEPEVEGFGFQYSWNLVVTNQRIIFASIDEALAERMTAWIERSAGRAGGVNMTGAPWEELLTIDPETLLLPGENFFLPLSAISSVDVVGGGPGQADEVCFFLPGTPYSLVFPGGTGAYARTVLSHVLQGRVHSG